jgi:hypothetical protein
MTRSTRRRPSWIKRRSRHLEVITRPPVQWAGEKLVLERSLEQAIEFGFVCAIRQDWVAGVVARRAPPSVAATVGSPA